VSKKKRTYNTRLIKCARSYTVQEISELFGTHKNTVRNWIKEGLPTIDGQKPFLVHGSDLIAFLNERQAKRKHKCKADEFFCFKCRIQRKAKSGSVTFITRNKTKLNIRAQCAVCATPVFRAGSVQKRANYERIFETETLAQERLIDTTTPTLNCYLKEDKAHDKKHTEILPPKRARQTDLFSVLEGSGSESGQHH
jgi:hypothetical protein